MFTVRRGRVNPSESTIRAVTSVSSSTTLARPNLPGAREDLSGQSRDWCPGFPQPKHALALISTIGLGQSRVGCSPPQLPQRMGLAEPITVFGGVSALAAWGCGVRLAAAAGGLRAAAPPGPRVVLTLPLKPPALMAMSTWL